MSGHYGYDDYLHEWTARFGQADYGEFYYISAGAWRVVVLQKMDKSTLEATQGVLSALNVQILGITEAGDYGKS